MKFLETNDMQCRLIVDGKVSSGQGSAYDVGKQFRKHLASTVHKKFEIDLIRPPSFDNLTLDDMEKIKSSMDLAFLAVHIGLTSYSRLGIEQKD
jgi:hypothetical protein